MKKLWLLLLIALLLLGGCANHGVSAKDIPASSRQSDSSPSQEPPLPSPSPTPSLPITQAHSQEIPKPSGDVIEIKEKMFVAQSNDVYINADEYMGKAIKWEGMFQQMTDTANGNVHNFVIRYGPGCCGYDANAGFEVRWDGDLPEVNDWVEAVGTLGTYEENGTEYLYVQLQELNILEQRGEEYVYQ